MLTTSRIRIESPKQQAKFRVPSIYPRATSRGANVTPPPPRAARPRSSPHHGLRFHERALILHRHGLCDA